LFSLYQQENKKIASTREKDGYGQKKNCAFFFSLSMMILTKRKEKKYALFILLYICKEEKPLARTANSTPISLN
jgi:hypothetical protein